MKIAFYVNELSLLRVFMPLAAALGRAFPGQEIDCYYTTESKKYHALGVKENLELFRKIVARVPSLRVREVNGRPACDALFTVETVGSFHFDYQRQFSVQHGFDYWFLAKNADDKTTYLMTCNEYEQDIHSRNPRIETMICPIPVTFWDVPESLSRAREHLRMLGFKGGKVVTIFYPETGYHDEIRSIIRRLEADGYFVVVKQRRKHQSVPADIRNSVYDDVWYPSESIYFPLASDATLGFGTSAFVDLAQAGMNFIDVGIPVPNFDVSTFIRPQRPNFKYVKANFEEGIFAALKELPPPPTSPGSLSVSVEPFLKGLLSEFAVDAGPAGKSL